MFVGYRHCKKCGKPLMGLFDGAVCDECEKAEQEPCDDIVSRDAINNLQKYRYNCGDTSITCVSLASINALPSVTHKSGKWIALKNRFELGNRVKCSECGQVFVVGDDVSRNFCPNCGACMKDGRTLDEFIEDSKESEDKG